MQHLAIIGHVGHAPKERTSTSGKTFYTFSVAVNDSQERTTWYNVIVNNPMAVLKYITKGREIYIYGSLSLGVYNGQIDATLHCISIQLIGKQIEQTEDDKELIL